MKRYSCIIFIGLILLSCKAEAIAASASGYIRKGNKLYKQQDFDEAGQEYEKAGQVLPDSDIVNFNLGAAFYKKGEYQKAVEAFTRALVTENPGIEAKADYNIGNAKYRQAQEAESTDLKAAAALLEESLGYYQRAIELNDKDEQAKANYEFVKKKAQELLKKMQQQEEQAASRKPQASGQEEEEGEEGEEQQAQAQQSQQQQAGQEKEGQEQKGQSQESEEKQRASASQQEDKEEKQKGQAEKEGEMSKEQALMLLEGYRQQEESEGQIEFQKKTAPYSKVLKDW